ncbi:MAG: TetR/AcrR family transcriptional regulator [Rhodocyclales bacterium]|nr:TetR/AcrR family transcriptional regulator [Rhodocyclales bacterium]
MKRKQTETPAPRRKPGRPMGGSVAADTRQRIIDTAIGCFARDGYAKASNKTIAAEAGVTAASLYHYFDSKAALYLSTLQMGNAVLVDAYRSACAELPEASSMEQLCLGIEKVIALSRRYPGLMTFCAASAGEIGRHEDLDWLDAKDADAFPAFFRELLQRARRRGELGRGINIEAAAQMLIACISGLAALHGTPVATKDFASVLRAFERMLSGDLMLKDRSP